MPNMFHYTLFYFCHALPNYTYIPLSIFQILISRQVKSTKCPFQITGIPLRAINDSSVVRLAPFSYSAWRQGVLRWRGQTNLLFHFPATNHKDEENRKSHSVHFSQFTMIASEKWTKYKFRTLSIFFSQKKLFRCKHTRLRFFLWFTEAHRR